ncbi:hypothetical protein [Arenibacter certesii]|uniref:Uncharacterized protein n=1 Tax=Arenibacter certesii TaxID=228955 RepID=A0A918J030_9FLAO|nr:hypothetical protein [Arenibacter certesii]GGW40857.1 hypothetical protein GCM10007383_27100 [Arenibacter certesii]
MKIALLFPNNVFTSPYLKYYKNILEKENIEYDLYTWDRNGVDEEGCIPFKNKVNVSLPLLRTLDFIKFRAFLTGHLKKNNYDKVIVFSGQLGILMGDYLFKYYPKKYILDIRDFSPVMNYFKNRFAKLVEQSFFVCISSNGFKQWLPPKGNYVLGHNIDIHLVEESLNNFPNREKTFEKKTLKVDTIGQIKDFNSDAKFIDQLKNDKRFEMEFIGFGHALPNLKEKINSEQVENIKFHGPYEKKEEPHLLKNTDLINILISRFDSNKGSTLLSNRLYLSALYNIPCIVNGDTEQSKIIKKYNLGIVVDRYEELPQKLITYRDNFCHHSFKNGCRAFLNDVKKDYSFFEKNVTNFLIAK